jgi:hypothetical protein
LNAAITASHYQLPAGDCRFQVVDLLLGIGHRTPRYGYVAPIYNQLPRRRLLSHWSRLACFPLVGIADASTSAAADGATIQLTDHYILDYQLEDPRIHVDMVTLDSGLANEYAEILLSGKSLTLPINSYFTFQQAILGDNPVVSITRAASRLRHIFMTFEGTLTPAEARSKSVVNDFSHPRRRMRWQPMQLLDNINFETQFQLGHKKMPHNPMNTVHDYWNQLRRVFGQLWDKEEPLDVDWAAYT